MRSKGLPSPDSATAGVLVEFYDFTIFGFAAASAFPEIFFPNLPPAKALVFSYLALGAGQPARLLGAFIFGHFGDRAGRKIAFLVNILIVGGSTCLTGLLPGYAKLGIMAPVLLVLLRIIQGIGVGGEFGGATSLLAEFGAKRKSRAFWMSLANLGISLGLISASAVFLVLSKTFATTGWRIAMLLSAVIVIPALVARYKLADSPYLSNSSGGSSLPECRASVFLEARGSHPPPCHGLGVPVDGLGRERNIRHLLHAFCRHSLGDHSTHHFCEPGR